MANTDFTRSQGETFRLTIDMEDGDCHPVQIADSNKNPLLYFAGLATKSGETSVPFRFKMHEVETRSYGRGSNRDSATGVFKVYAYIPADEIGSCSNANYSNRIECEVYGETWAVDSSAIGTSQMAKGDWEYEVRMAEASDVSGLEVSATILTGTLTIVDGAIDTTPGSSFTFDAPSV